MPKNIVICCDGTGDDLRHNLTNVSKIYRALVADDQQLVHYHPGIGTVGMPSQWARKLHRLKEIFELASGSGLYDQVFDCYKYLVENSEPGDTLSLIGFSRGAYAARVLGGFVSLYGVMRRGENELAQQAFLDYLSISGDGDMSKGHRFKNVYKAHDMPIDFIGAWDTVNSVIVPRFDWKIDFESLPYALGNPEVKIFRQALAIDERRLMFRPKPWDMALQPRQAPVKSATDIKQVWFAGEHGDVGGGWPEPESGLSKYPLLWMIREAQASGLRFDEGMISHIVLGANDREGGHVYTPPSPTAPLHNSMTGAWRLLEIMPRPSSERAWPRRPGLGPIYFPLAEPRVIAEEAMVHVSVAEIMAKTGYNPVNLPASWQWEREPGYNGTNIGPTPLPVPKHIVSP